MRDGNYIVSKRNNPEKQGRFQNEQKIVSEISNRMGFDKNKEIKYKDFSVSLINPSAIISIPCSDRYYSIMAHQKGNSFGLNTEYYPFLKDNFEKFVFDNPQFLVNILYSNPIYLKPKIIDRVSNLKIELLQNKNYLAKALSFYLKSVTKEEKTNKLLLEGINLMLYLSNSDKKLSGYNEILEYYKSTLLFNKLYKYYEGIDLLKHQEQSKK